MYGMLMQGQILGFSIIILYSAYPMKKIMSSLGKYSEYKETNIKINTMDRYYAYMQHSNITGRKKKTKMYTHKSKSELAFIPSLQHTVNTAA